MVTMNPEIQRITDGIIERSRVTRAVYLSSLEKARKEQEEKPAHLRHGCSNHSHVTAPADSEEKKLLNDFDNPKRAYAVVNGDSDMLSAQKPYRTYLDRLKNATKKVAATALLACGLGSICDGLVQGTPGMKRSLPSRDTIANTVNQALWHKVFDGVLGLAMCDKIVPGVLRGFLQHGYLPAILVPAGPMPTGLVTGEQKKAGRAKEIEGKITRSEMRAIEDGFAHGEGTCTFYGTANTNQMLLEFMGLVLSNSAFINPNTDLRRALTDEAALRLDKMAKEGVALSDILTEKTFVNTIVGLMATGGSTNLVMHLIAIAKSAGIIINLEDFDAISKITPRLVDIYPNCEKYDINDFEKAGGVAVIMRELIEHGYLHQDVQTVEGVGLGQYLKKPRFLTDDPLHVMDDGVPVDEKKYKTWVEWVDGPKESLNQNVIRSFDNPFDKEGGIKLIRGSVAGIMKVSAVKHENQHIQAPAMVFDDQEDVQKAYKDGTLARFCQEHGGVVIVLRFQGVNAAGMPELHQVIPPLAKLQKEGFKVGLVTDGRLSGASGDIPAAIHCEPEALNGGWLAKVQNGDPIDLNGRDGTMDLLVGRLELWRRPNAEYKMAADLVSDPLTRSIIATMSPPSLGAIADVTSIEEYRKKKLQGSLVKRVAAGSLNGAINGGKCVLRALHLAA